MAKYYTYINGQQSEKSYTVQELKELAIDKSVKVSEEGTEKWLNAEDVEELKIIWKDPVKKTKRKKQEVSIISEEPIKDVIPKPFSDSEEIDTESFEEEKGIVSSTIKKVFFGALVLFLLGILYYVNGDKNIRNKEVVNDNAFKDELGTNDKGLTYKQLLDSTYILMQSPDGHDLEKSAVYLEEAFKKEGFNSDGNLETKIESYATEMLEAGSDLPNRTVNERDVIYSRIVELCDER